MEQAKLYVAIVAAERRALAALLDVLEQPSLLQQVSDMINEALVALQQKDIASTVRIDLILIRACAMHVQPPVLKALRQAACHVRDLVAMRVQLTTPLTSRSAFIHAIGVAYNEHPPRHLPVLLHAHRHSVAKLFNYTFPSNTELKTGTSNRRNRKAKKKKEGAGASSHQAASDTEESRAASSWN